MTRDDIVERLMAGGFVAPEEEADELLAAAREDGGTLEAMLARRLTGEPLAWITGTTVFCGLTVHVAPGVYVPRWQTEALTERAVARLPDAGIALDLCTGCGAIAAVLRRARPGATVIATDLDADSVACAVRNGVDARAGDLYAPVPAELRGQVDVIVSVVPYVPTPELGLLQRDTLTFESLRSYDGGEDGLVLLRRVALAAPDWLTPGGALLLELGGDQADALLPALVRFARVSPLIDEDGDVRGIEAVL